MKFIAYYRVSTSHQGKTGLGLDAQRASVAKYIASTDGSLVGEYTEVVSGLQNNRDALTAALKRCRVESATLVIAKLDRLARRLSFLSSFIESDVPLVVADMPNANKFVLQMMAVLAETERDMIAERTKQALAAAKERGVRLGNPLIAQAREQAGKVRKRRATDFALSMAPQISAMRAAGLSYRHIADKLNRSGAQTAYGGQWWPTTVSNAIKLAEASTTLEGLFESFTAK